MKTSTWLALLVPAVAFALAPRPHGGAVPAPYENPVNPVSEIEFAAKFFRSKILIPEAIYPTRALGAFIILNQDGTLREFTRVRPDKPFPEPEIVKDTVFEAIVDKNLTASAGYLSFVNAEIKTQDKAAVTLKCVLKAKGLEFYSPEIQEVYAKRLESLPLQEGDRLFYSEAILVLLAESTVLSTDSAKANAAFVVQVGGQNLYSNSRVQSQRITVVEAIELKIPPRGMGTKGITGDQPAVLRDFPLVVTKASARLRE